MYNTLNDKLTPQVIFLVNKNFFLPSPAKELLTTYTALIGRASIILNKSKKYPNNTVKRSNIAGAKMRWTTTLGGPNNLKNIQKEKNSILKTEIRKINIKTRTSGRQQMIRENPRSLRLFCSPS